MSGISAIIKETQESSLIPSLMWGHSEKMATYEPGKELSPDTNTGGTLILDFPVSRTVRSKCFLFKSPSLWYFCYNSLNGLTQEKRVERSDGN